MFRQELIEVKKINRQIGKNLMQKVFCEDVKCK